MSAALPAASNIFPGHGSAAADSHLGFVDISEQWQEIELEPYVQLFAAGFADSVMTAHVVNRQLDPEGLPATLSEAVISGLLRNRIGFDGVVISDDLQMKAISDQWSFEEAVQRAVLAGVDLLIVGNNLVREHDIVARGTRAIEELLDNGRCSEDRIRAASEPDCHTETKDNRRKTMVGQSTHNLTIGYLIWIFGFLGAHRFYYGKPISGTVYFFTLGLFFIGWIVDLFLLPSMDRQADIRFIPGRIDFTVAWLLLVFLGPFGIHRMYMGKWVTGIIYLLTGGLFLIGYIYDMWTLNDQITLINGREDKA